MCERVNRFNFELIDYSKKIIFFCLEKHMKKGKKNTTQPKQNGNGKN